MLDEGTLNACFVSRRETLEVDLLSEVRHTAELAKALSDQGAIVIVSLPTRMEQQRLLAREILGDSLFLIQLNCTRTLRDVRAISSGPLPEDGLFETSEFGSHMISTDKISGLQTAQLILKLLRLRQEHPARVGASFVDKPVLRRIFPRDQTAQGVSQVGGATVQPLETQSGHAPVEKSRAAHGRHVLPVGVSMKISQEVGENQTHGQVHRDDQGQPHQVAPPREAASKTWRGTLETGVTKDSEATGAGATFGAQGKGRADRHRSRRFVENQELVWSPSLLIIITICTGIVIALFIWVIDASVKKKGDKERLLEGNAPSAEVKAK